MSETRSPRGGKAPARWTVEEARRRFKINERPMPPHELVAIRKLLGDAERGDMSQEVFAALLGIKPRQLRNMEHGTRVRSGKVVAVEIPTLVAREARRLADVRRRGE
jgi:DNA-binding transcriptional regulator YiaG